MIAMFLAVSRNQPCALHARTSVQIGAQHTSGRVIKKLWLDSLYISPPALMAARYHFSNSRADDVPTFGYIAGLFVSTSPV